MLFFFFACLSPLLLAFAACVWLLDKDRTFWRDQYRTLAIEAREREKHLFDQLLLVKGFRTTTEPVAPPSHGVARQPALDAEDLEIIDSRINERIEAGILTASEGHLWANQIRDGSLTPAQIDRMFRQRQQNEFPGSVADID